VTPHVTPNNDLKTLIGGIEGFADWTHADRIRLFAWFQHAAKDLPTFTTSDISACYDSLNYERPNVSQYLSDMASRKPPALLRKGGGYALEARIRAEYEAKYGKRGATIAVDKALAELPGKVPDKAEKDFLQEVLICFRNGACRAAIVMMWNLAYFHLCYYILKHKLAEFNAAYPTRLGGIHKKAKIQTITRYEDFSVDLEESEVIAIAKAAGVITHDQWKILDGKLGRRNSAAHPSTVAFLAIHTEECILDLATNIILAMPL
jgi:hypothetical protein